MLQIQGAIDEAIAGLKATARIEASLVKVLRPQTETAYRAALTGYQLGRGDLVAVLEAARQIQMVRLESLKLQAERQTLFAEIERAVGGDL